MRSTSPDAFIRRLLSLLLDKPNLNLNPNPTTPTALTHRLLRSCQNYPSPSPDSDPLLYPARALTLTLALTSSLTIAPNTKA